MKVNQVMPLVGREEAANVVDAIDNKWLSEGPWCEKFLAELQALSGANYAVFAPNGTLGLYLAIVALDLPPNSEILVPSFTFFGSASSIVFAGHTPVFVDVSMSDYTMDAADLRLKITEKTAAIMGVHIYGQAARVDEIAQIAHEYDLKFIEDAAQAIGVTFEKQHAGTLGDIGVISFFADKTITTGEGAVIFCKDETLWQRLRLLRNQGRPNSGTFVHEALGMNFRITDMQAAVGYTQLIRLPGIQRQRAASYDIYERQLKDCAHVNFMEIDPRSSFTPFRFPFTSEKKVSIQRLLEEKGVQTRSFFYPMHLQPPLQKYRGADCRCPNSEILYEQGLALPIHSGVSTEMIEHICGIIRSA